jgi:hypothetical protein
MKPVLEGNAAHVLLTWPTLRQLRRLCFCPGLGKPFGLPQARAMFCLPVPGLSLCHLLSSAGAFSVRLAGGRPGSPDIGAAVRFAVTFVAIRRR